MTHPGARGRLSAVIFDGDGVLICSMERNADAYQAALAAADLPIAREDVYLHEGRRSRELIDRVARAHGRCLEDAQLDELTRQHQRIFSSFGPMPLYPDVEPLLRRLASRRVRTGMVTANSRENAERNLGRYARLLDVIVTAEDVRHTKPDPEPYLTALDRLGITSRSAVVVENAPLGIASARSAGLAVVGVTSTNPADRLRGAEATIDRLAELPATLARLGWTLER